MPFLIDRVFVGCMWANARRVLRLSTMRMHMDDRRAGMVVVFEGMDVQKRRLNKRPRQGAKAQNCTGWPHVFLTLSSKPVRAHFLQTG